MYLGITKEDLINEFVLAVLQNGYEDELHIRQTCVNTWNKIAFSHISQRKYIALFAHEVVQSDDDDVDETELNLEALEAIIPDLTEMQREIIAMSKEGIHQHVIAKKFGTTRQAITFQLSSIKNVAKQAKDKIKSKKSK